MLRSFPPFPSPGLPTMNNGPFENIPVVPSPPSSTSSSVVSSPSSIPSTPASPISRTGSGNTDEKRTRSRSRSSARSSVPPRTRIIKHNQGAAQDSRPVSTPHSPPITPPLEIKRKPVEETKKEVKIPDVRENEASRKKSVRTHNYEDAMRIACGAWSETGPKKKTVSWKDKEVSA